MYKGEIMGDIVDFTGTTLHDISPDKVLEAAIGKLEDVLVCGKDKNGDMYVAASTSETGRLLLFMELAKGIILE